MRAPAIRVSHLSKQYRIGASPDEYRTVREAIGNLARLPARVLRRRTENRSAIWALKDVSFDVQPGETLGVIGRNGAGKSTLLKVLSRITEPTSGSVELRGRVASLLEVGTGFHPELTGRENVFLNGAILGMLRREIAAKFDEIVAFAEVEKFIDTPVKRYSSGMRLRLAFAVAANLDPEILVIDEVLAVGDALFQRRCIDRMKALAGRGCTLLFVSHNMEMVPVLCRQAIWLRGGELVESGGAAEVTERYLADLTTGCAGGALDDRPRSGDGRARFARFRLVDERGHPSASVKSGRDLRCLLEIRAKAPVSNVSLSIVVKTLGGARLITGWTDEVGFRVDLPEEPLALECRFRNVPIRPGRQVAVELWMHDGALLDHLDTAVVYDVVEAEPSGMSLRQDQGAFLVDYQWLPGPPGAQAGDTIHV